MKLDIQMFADEPKSSTLTKLYYADAKEQVMKLVMKSDSLYDRCSMSYDGKYIYMDNITFQNMTRTVEKRR